MKKKRFEIFRTLLRQAQEGESERKSPFSVSLTPSQKAWLQEQPNASALLQGVIDSKIKKELNEHALKLLVNILLKYDLAKIPKREELERFDKQEPNSFERKIREDGKFREVLLTDYVDYVLCAGGGTELTGEETEFLKSLNTINREQLIELIWTAFSKYLKETEIKEGLPLIKFIYDLHEAKHKPQTVKELADRAGVEYQVFYHKFLPRFKHIEEWTAFFPPLS